MINLLSLDVINKEAPYKVDWDEIQDCMISAST